MTGPIRRRLRRPGATASVAAAAAALLLSGCGGGSHPRSDTVPDAGAALGVSPGAPHPGDAITFSFTAPVATGIDGRYRIGYSVSVTGPSGDDCVGAREVSIARVARGATATATIGPDQLGRPWCAGRYSARAFELESAACRGTAPCPQFIRVVGIVARATYTVS
jgi:hypothetical protein